jgi:N6-adenosine-specific RNA methylase IME4
VFKRGRIPKPRGARNIQQLVRSPRKEHSEKPIEVMQAIEKMFPTQERIELFARRKFEGWSVWGLDIIMKNNSDNDLLKSTHQPQVLEEPQKPLFPE